MDYLLFRIGHFEQHIVLTCWRSDGTLDRSFMMLAAIELETFLRAEAGADDNSTSGGPFRHNPE